VIASRAVVTTNHPQAIAAALEILAMGGNAVDAAVTALSLLSVVEPMMVSPHGAGVCVIRDGRTGNVVTIDNHATVPLRAHAGMVQPIPGSLENDTEDAENDVGYLAVATPGNLAGWARPLRRRDRLARGGARRPRARRGPAVWPGERPVVRPAIL